MGTWPRLTSDQLDLTVTNYDFTQSLTDTLGNLGTDSDGFDSEVLDLATLLTSANDPGAPIDGDLGLAGSIAGSIDPNSLAGDAASLPASLAAGDSILSDANGLLGSVQPVPAPPSGGTGGTGGGTAGGGGPTPAPPPKADYSFTVPSAQAFPAVPANLQFFNNTKAPVAVSFTKFDNGAGGGIGFFNQNPTTIQPNKRVIILSTWAVGPTPGNYTGRVTIATTGPRKQLIVELSGHVTPVGQDLGEGQAAIPVTIEISAV